MHLKVLYTSFIFCLIVGLFFNFKGGPAGAQGEDRTGGPLSDDPCQTCHSSGAFSPELNIAILDEGVGITDYEPGKTYTFKATINHSSGTPQVFGLQSVILTGADNQNAGSFGTPPDGTAVVTLNGRDYFEHDTPNSENTFEIEWTAPESGTGDVNIYAACVAANNNNSTAGDGSVFLPNPIVLSELVTSLSSLDIPFAKLRVLGNPVKEQLNLEINSALSGQFQLRVLGLNGQVLQSQTISLINGQNLVSLDFNNIPNGVHFVQLSDGNNLITSKVIK